MGKFSDHIQSHHRDFIEKQQMFFVASSPLGEDGRINLSPKGIDGFKVLSGNRVGYMDFVGSGNETSAHLLENGRITFMFCAFDGPPNILRLYGKGYTVLPGSEHWETYAPHFQIYPSTRQLIVADIDLVQTSCGYGVPLMDYKGMRPHLFDWSAKKGEIGLKQYIHEKNLVSIDGLPTAHSVIGDW
jgi:hypothetical protein